MNLSNSDLINAIKNADALASTGNEEAIGDIQILLNEYKQRRQGVKAELAEGPRVIAKVRKELPKTGSGKFGSVQSGTLDTEKKELKLDDPKEFYSKRIPLLLGIGEEDFDYSQSADLGKRFGMDFLRNKSDRETVLRREFGDENVFSANLGGQQKILFKKPETGKWGFYDSFDKDLADFTADLAGDIVPIGSGIAAGTATLIKAPLTGGTSLLATSAVAAGTEAAVGASQDAIARSAFGLDVDPGEIAAYRATEGGINFSLNLLTMGTGKAPVKTFLGVKGAKEATEQAMSVLENSTKRVPVFVQKGGSSLQRAQDLASKYPNSAVAKMFAESRELAEANIQKQFGAGEITAEQSEQILRESLETVQKQYSDDIGSIARILENLSAEKIAIKEGIPRGLDKKARKEAIKIFNAELSKKSKNVRAPQTLSPEQTGQSLQQNIANKYVQVEASSRNTFQLISQTFEDIGVNVDARRVANIFTKRKNQAITDMEGEILSVLAPNARTTAGRASTSLKELVESGETISFKQLNEIIQELETKTLRGSATPGFNAAEYRNITNSLRNLRGTMLKDPSVSPALRKSYLDANKNFQEVVLPYRISDVFKSIDSEIGDSYSRSILKAQNGQPFKLPRFESGGTAVLDRAFLNPKSIKDFLRATGNDPTTRRLLQDQWLSSKGLVAGKPIYKKNLNFTEKDFDIANVLFPGKGKNSFSAKYNTLKSLKQFTDGADDYIDGLTAETFDRLMKQGVEGSEREIRRMGAEEVIQKTALDKLTSQKLIKMFNQGSLPLPKNQATMESFIDGILKSSPDEIDKFIKIMTEKNADALPAFKQAVYQRLTTKSSSKVHNSAQKNVAGEAIWDPVAMDAQLIRNRDALVRLLGRKKYDSIKLMNEGMQKFAIDPTKSGKLKIAGAGNESGFKAFVSDIPGTVRDRFGALLLAKEIKDPTHFKKMLTQEAYDKTMTALNTSLFFGLNSIRAIQDNADADPLFRKNITQKYQTIFEEAAESALAVELN